MSKTGSEIAEAIRAAARRRGVSVKQTLCDCKINRNFLYDLERGNSSPSVDKLSRIADYFGIGVAQLLASDDEFSRFSALYCQLSAADRKKLLAYMEGLCEG